MIAADLMNTANDDDVRSMSALERMCCKCLRRKKPRRVSSIIEVPDTTAETRPSRTVRDGPVVISNTVKESVIKNRKSHVNQYSLQHEIGYGSYGSVQLAINTLDGHSYAIKEVSKQKILGPRAGAGQGVHTKLREIAVMKKLNHPNIVSLFEVIDDPTHDSVFLVLEYVPKGTLAAMIDQCGGSLEEERIRRYTRDIVCALKYIHSQKITHRDIKPENLLITEDDHIKITDFGVATTRYISPSRSTARPPASGTRNHPPPRSKSAAFAGTPAFAAPEAVKRPEEQFKLTGLDVWSLGVTVYMMAFGSSPFTRDTITRTYSAIVNDSFECENSDRKLSLDLQDLLLKMLEKNPFERISIEAVIEHPWITDHGKEPIVDIAESAVTVSLDEQKAAFLAIDSPSAAKFRDAVTAVSAAVQWRKMTLRNRDLDPDLNAEADGPKHSQYHHNPDRLTVDRVKSSPR